MSWGIQQLQGTEGTYWRQSMLSQIIIRYVKKIIEFFLSFKKNWNFLCFFIQIFILNVNLILFQIPPVKRLPQYKCRECDHSFPSRGHLHQHVNNHARRFRTSKWTLGGGPMHGIKETHCLKWRFQKNVQGQPEIDFRSKKCQHPHLHNLQLPHQQPGKRLKRNHRPHRWDVSRSRSSLPRLMYSLESFCVTKTALSDIFVPHENNNLFNYPHIISNIRHLRQFKLKLKNTDFVEFLKQQRPNSKWKVLYITNVVMTVFPIGYTLGRANDLPGFITSKKSIAPMNRKRCNGHHPLYQWWSMLFSAV